MKTYKFHIVLVALVVISCLTLYATYPMLAKYDIIGSTSPQHHKKIVENDYIVDWNSIEVRWKPARHLLHDKWIVITTINPPTPDVKKLATIPGWKVVVVGDTKSPQNWR